MRAFIAIELPKELNSFLRQLQEKLKGLGKLNLTKAPYHLTLKFLGEISEEQCKEIGERLKEIKIKHFFLELTGIGVFPNEDYVKVIWIGVKGEIISLQKEVEEKLSDIFKKDSGFHPHITLARVKSVNDKEKLKSFLKHETGSKGFEVREFKLIKSELTPGGPRYTDLDAFEL